ncbi:MULTISPECIES: FecCD family ABC transporter permease [Aeromicrobium]|uniref:Iron complex transport system permease protein n=1 Tax=Aeromicrobium tamlense TaxID=375541 RepID=A0ABX2SN30_9ACTN|nr:MULTISPECIES: iron ABC transporter permease [Aeromicrobium]NYI39005.1 iron complex transport system permease protein [Aeromicrobium tamlense]
MVSTGRRTLVLAGFAVLLVVGTFVSASVGQLPVGPRDVAGAMLHGIGIDTSWRPDDTIIEQTLLQIRFPRVAMSILVGATLAVAGAVMQAIFGNPLAEPGVVGVSAGAALGASIAIAFGITAFAGWGVAVLAFVGGFAATVLVYATARVGGRTEVVTLLLTGIAVNAFAGAGLALVMFASDTGSREQIVFWQLGSMNGSRWSEVLIVAAVGLPACVVACLLARRYDLLSLGERTAAHLGLRVERLRIGSILLVALLTGVAVAFAGIISFVGLVVPHLVRMLLGPSHRTLLLASVIGGAALLVWADLLARTLVSGSDLPIGLLTSLIGGPFFFYLVRATRSKAGGWA